MILRDAPLIELRCLGEAPQLGDGYWRDRIDIGIASEEIEPKKGARWTSRG